MKLIQSKKLALATSFAIAGFTSFNLNTAQASTAELSSAHQLEAVKIYANSGQFNEFNAPFATEIFQLEDINSSGAINLYDFLNRFSLVNVTSGSGNEYQQKLDMRGYGLGDGYQNLVITLNGRRLNNIDMQSQLLGNLPLASIERIEIIKGSGSVANGDGAMAGTINIVTRDFTGLDLSLIGGNNGYRNSGFVAGVQQELFAVQLSADKKLSDGVRARDINGNTDESDVRSFTADLKLFPTDGLEIKLSRASSRIATFYASPLTKAEFDNNPKQAGLNPWSTDPLLNAYTENELKVDTTGVGISYIINQQLAVYLDHTYEKKEADNKSFFMFSKYDYRFTNLASEFNYNQFALVAGVQLVDGERVNDATAFTAKNETNKDNQAVYLQGNYTFGDTLINAGVRHEKVKYSYQEAGADLKDRHKLNAWELGANHQLSQQLSMFANFSRGFQAPDIDRFFDLMAGTPSFNGFIEPAKVKNFNLGLNHFVNNNQLKITAFYARLRNEIYYYSDPGFINSKNTNFDKTHKYGVEVQEKFILNEQLSLHANYAWTQAKIDRDTASDGAYDGKRLPGVSKHTISAGIDYKPLPQSTVSLTQTWRSSAYAAEDFANNFQQKQKSYNTTDLGYSHTIQQFTLFAQVNNLFDKKNGLWVRDDAIYPVNFTRTWYAGIRASF